ncbi:MAG: histidine triad nucleotide-binding protein [Vicinamibacterales bacterium]
MTLADGGPYRLGMSSACVFCRIVAGEIPSTAVHDDEHVYAFADINPQAPLHLLVVPKRHIATLNDLSPEDDALVGEVVRTGSKLARERGYGERGYRLVFNCNRDAGQTVFHVHLHVLAGRGLTWPPG